MFKKQDKKVKKESPSKTIPIVDIIRGNKIPTKAELEKINSYMDAFMRDFNNTPSVDSDGLSEDEKNIL